MAHQSAESIPNQLIKVVLCSHNATKYSFLGNIFNPKIIEKMIKSSNKRGNKSLPMMFELNFFRSTNLSLRMYPEIIYFLENGERVLNFDDPENLSMWIVEIPYEEFRFTFIQTLQYMNDNGDTIYEDQLVFDNSNENAFNSVLSELKAIPGNIDMLEAQASFNLHIKK
jgi:hypothetical protein